MRVLVMRFSALGDIALTIPVIKELKEQHPGLELYFLSRPRMASLFQPLEVNFMGVDIDQKHKSLIGLFKLSKEIARKIDPHLIIDLHNVLRTKILSFFWKARFIPVFTIDKGWGEKRQLTRAKNKIFKPLKHTTQRYLETFKKAGLGFNFDLESFSGLEYRNEKAENLISHIKSQKRTIGIAPFAQYKEKIWPLEKMKGLVKQLSDKDFSIYLFGSKAERGDLQELIIENKGIQNLAGRFDLATELHLISHLKMMLSMDSFNVHLAALTGIPVVSIWGATHSYAGFAPLGNNENFAVQIPTDKLTCRPCSVFGNKHCFRGDHACLNWIKASDVMDKINQVMDKQ